MSRKIGDIRITAEYMPSPLPRDEQGEIIPDKAEWHAEEAPTEEAAANIARERDLDGEGRVIVERWASYGWEHVSQRGSWEYKTNN